MTKLDAATLQATAVSWGQFSGPHLWAAAHFAREAHRLEEEGLQLPRPEDNHNIVRWNVIGAVLTSVAAVEAYAGEVAVKPEERFPNQPAATARAEVEKMLKGSSVIPKFRKLAELADGSTSLAWMPTEEQALDDLIQLRNKLVHFTAEPPWARNAHDMIEQRLSGRFSGSRLLPGARFFPDGFDSYACAKWCVETARAFVEAFASRYGWPVAFITKASHAPKLALP